MGYVSHMQLAERPGAMELAQVASDAQGAVVDAGLMDALLRAADTSTWPTPALAAAQRALARIDEAVAEADARINGFLAQRGYSLPLAEPPGIIAGWSRDIARYLLHKDRIQDERVDPIARAYRDAMKLLADVAAGRFALGIADPLAPAAQPASPRYAASEPVWSRDTLQDFTQ